MNFSIITPSRNQWHFLERSIASVRDQVTPEAQRLEVRGQRADLPITIHQHIQDACSIDGTVDWLPLHDAEVRELRSEDRAQSPGYSFTYTIEQDDGMYDAINRGADFILKNQSNECLLLNGKELRADAREKPHKNYQRTTINSSKQVVAWLNCDEQYLPGTLGKVSTFFQEHPETDILFGGMLVVDENGELLSCRKAMPMRTTFLEASYLYNFSCAMFFRRSLWEKLGGFDTAYKNAGDEELIRRALSAGARTAVLDEYLSTFTYRTDNLSSDPKAADEHAELKGEDGLFVRSLKSLINLMRLAEKWMRGGHRQTGPIEYDIYFNSSEKRQHFVCENPTTRWPDHAYPYLLRHRLNR